MAGTALVVIVVPPDACADIQADLAEASLKMMELSSA